MPLASIPVPGRLALASGLGKARQGGGPAHPEYAASLSDAQLDLPGSNPRLLATMRRGPRSPVLRGNA